MIAIYTAHFFNKSGFGVGKINHNYAWECRSVGPKMKKCDFMPGYAFNQLQVDTKAQPSPLVHLNSCLCPYRQPQVIFNRVIALFYDLGWAIGDSRVWYGVSPNDATGASKAHLGLYESGMAPYNRQGPVAYAGTSTYISLYLGLVKSTRVD